MKIGGWFSLLLVLGAGHPAPGASQGAPGPWQAEDEVFYHIFVRSFRDSNGDRIGDLRGIQDRLGYLQDLGVTSLLLTPINPSPFYHNYFATSFEGVDPDYGDPAAFRDLVGAIHGRGMKIYLDEEIQYVTPDNPWWRESLGKPESPYGRFVLYQDSANTRTEPAFFGLSEVPTWSGAQIGLGTVNLVNSAVQKYFADLFAALVDPNHDGRFEDGIDGFRIDHMMDTLDAKPQLGGLFARFWAPVFARAREVNPRIKIIAEQYDWGYGEEYLTRGGADLVFAFPIRSAVVAMNGPALREAISRTEQATGTGKGQVLFIENHDTDRFASLVEGHAGKERLGAALMILLKGTPSIYYGQEIGMRGRQFKAWGSDANDIPVREAFEWTREGGGAGSAEWYRDTGEWWNRRYARDGDGISVEEQEADSGSLLSFYRRALRLRRSRPELVGGDQAVVDIGQPNVLAVLRRVPGSMSLLLVNLAESPVTVDLRRATLSRVPDRWSRAMDLSGGEPTAPIAAGVVKLAPYGIKLLSP